MVLSAQLSARPDEVLAHFGIANAAIHDIRTGRVNKHWRVEVGDATFALRRYSAERSESAIRYEHDALSYLQNMGWPVASPLPVASGDGSVACLDGRYFALFPFLAGKPAPQSLSYARLKGGLLARLHQDFAAWEPPGQREGFGRVWELDVYVAAQSEFASLNELLFAFGQVDSDLARAIRAQKYATLRELSTLGYGELPAVPGHFDFHHDNLLFYRGELSGLLDLDMTHLDARVADVASSIFLDCYAPPAYSEISPTLAAEFVSGYVEHAPLSDAESELIVPLVRAAILGLVVWRLTRWARGDEPEYALRSLQRSMFERFPSLARRRNEMEAAVLQAATSER